jgi:thioredoxin reductase
MASDITVAAVRNRLMEGLAKYGVGLLNNVDCKEIREDGLVYANKDGKPERLQTDTVVIAVGSVAKGDLFRALRGNVPDLYQAGDAVQPARISEAIESGLRVGLAI